MSDWILAAATAVWLGVLTSISPCLMATNIAAISFLARRVASPGRALVAGLSYMAGQAAAYVVLGGLVVESLLSAPLVSHWLQTYLLKLLGPLLIVTAVFLLELIEVRLGGGRLRAWAQQKAAAGGYGFGALLGVAFALTFCPVTAAFYFGGLVPLAIARESSVVLPLSFAIGVAAPVLLFALVIVLAANQLGRVFADVGRAEWWARRVTGALFLLIGLYFTLEFTLGVL